MEAWTRKHQKSKKKLSEDSPSSSSGLIDPAVAEAVENSELTDAQKRVYFMFTEHQVLS